MSGASRYAEYMASPVWRKHVRPRLIERAQVFVGWESYRCERCRREFPREAMNVHHKHYGRLYGAECPEDVEILCLTCHREADKEREARERERALRNEEAQANSHWRARIDGFMGKKHGADWSKFYTRDEAEEELEQFLERIEGREE